MAAAVSSPKGVIVAGVRFSSPPSARRASEPGTPSQQHLARLTHGTSHGRELGASWVRGQSLPNHGATIPSGSLSTVLDVAAAEPWRPGTPKGRSEQELLGQMRLGAQPTLDPSWLPPQERARQAVARRSGSDGVSKEARGEFGSIMVQSAGAVLLGDEEHKELLGQQPPLGECSSYQFLSKLSKTEAKTLLRSKGILLDDATVDEFITVFDVREDGVLDPTQLTALARVLEREQWRVAKTKSGRMVIEREHRRRVAEVRAKRMLDSRMEEKGALGELSEDERITVEAMATQKADDATRLAAAGAEHGADTALLRIVQSFEPEFRPGIRKILPAILQAVVCPGYPPPDPLAPPEVEAEVELGQTALEFFKSALGDAEGEVLGTRCKEEGFETVDELLAAGLSEGDLRELGLVQMKSRKKVIQLLARLAQQPLGPSVNDSLLPRQAGYSDESDYSDEAPSPSGERRAHHTRDETDLGSDDYGAARWAEHKAAREGRDGNVHEEECDEESTLVPEEQIGSLLGKLGTGRRERNLAKWRQTEDIAATRIQAVFRGRRCRAKIQANLAKGLHPTAVSAYEYALKSGLIKESPGAHKQEAMHGHASIYNPNMIDRTTEIDLSHELPGARWLDSMLGFEPEPEPEPEPGPEPEPEPEPSAYTYARKEGLLGADKTKTQKGTWRRRKGARRKKVQPVDLTRKDDSETRSTDEREHQEEGQTTTRQPAAETHAWTLPEADANSKALRHATNDLHYSAGNLLRLSKADFDLEVCDGDSDNREVGFEPTRILWNPTQYVRILVVHLVFFALGPLLGCPLAAHMVGTKGAQNMGLLPVCCAPEPGKHESARYIRWLFVAQVSGWMLTAPLSACLLMRAAPDLVAGSDFGCNLPSTVELVLPLLLVALHSVVTSIKYGLMPVAEVDARRLRHRLPVRLKMEQLLSWTLSRASSKALVERELLLSMHRQGMSARQLRKTVLIFSPNILTRNPVATNTQELNDMQHQSSHKYVAPPTVAVSPADRLAGPQDAMKVTEVAVEAVMKRLVQFSLEPNPRRRWYLPVMVVAGLCIAFGYSPIFVRLGTSAPLPRTWMEIGSIACSGLVSAGLLGTQLAYMWMASVDINRRHIRLEILGYMFQLNGKRHGIPRYNRFPLLVEDSPQNIHVWMDVRQLLCGFGEGFLRRVQLMFAGWLLLDIMLVLMQVSVVLYRPASTVPIWIILLCGYSIAHCCGLATALATAQRYNSLTAEHQTAFSVARRRSLREAWNLEKEPGEALKLARRLGVWVDEKSSGSTQEPQWRQDARWQISQVEKLYAAAAVELTDTKQTGVYISVFGSTVGTFAVAIGTGLAALSLLSTSVLLSGGAALGREQVCVQPEVTCSWPGSGAARYDTAAAYTVADLPLNESSGGEGLVGNATESIALLSEIELTFDLDLASLDNAVFADTVLADLTSSLGVGVDDVELISVRAGSVVVTVRLTPAAYAALLEAFSSGTLGPIAGNAVVAVGTTHQSNVSSSTLDTSDAWTMSSSASASWYEDETAWIPCGGQCPDGGRCVEDICYSPRCFENATVIIDPWRSLSNAGNPPPYDSRFHADSNGTDSVAFVYHSLANHSLLTFAVIDDSSSGSWAEPEPEPEPLSCGPGATTLGGLAPDGSVCSFPFDHSGENFNECTDRDNNGTLWCAVVGAGDGTRSWGNCDLTRCDELSRWRTIPHAYCDMSSYIESFHTRQEAEAACTEEVGCFGIYDHRCDGLSTLAEWRGGFHTCSTPSDELGSSSTGGCVYERIRPMALPTTLGATPHPGTLPAAIPLEVPAAEKSCGAWFSGWLSSYELPPPSNVSANTTGSWGLDVDEEDEQAPAGTFNGIGSFPRPEEYTQERVACFTAGRDLSCAHYVVVSVTSCPADIRYTLPEAPTVGFHGAGYCAEPLAARECGPVSASWETESGVCSNGGAWSGMLCPLSCPPHHHWAIDAAATAGTIAVAARCVDGEWRAAENPLDLPQACAMNPCGSEPTFIPQFSASRSQCTGTLAAHTCAFQCVHGYTPSTTAVCYQGGWRLADPAAAGGGCRVDNVTATAASESELRWYEVLGYVGDRTPLLPLLMALAALLLVLMVCGARRAFRWHRTKIEEERSRSCRPIDSVGHKFTMGRKRFGTLPPVITDPVERMEANNLTSYTPQRGAPGA
eukprot:COSAG06_NODE_1499_length_9263_cov_2.385312_1_plen_2165_part_10